jgi:hypothetical protein
VSLAALVAGGALAIGDGSPRLPGECRTVHGRLNAWNGGTPFKIWVVGSHHMLGVENADEKGENLPPDLVQALDSRGDRFAVSIFADFKVCATAAFRPGHLQPVRVIDAKHIRIEPR